MFSEFLLPVQTGPEKCFLLHIQPLSPYPEVFNLLLTPCLFLIWLFLFLSLFLILFLISRTNHVSSSLSFSFFLFFFAQSLTYLGLFILELSFSFDTLLLPFHVLFYPNLSCCVLPNVIFWYPCLSCHILPPTKSCSSLHFPFSFLFFLSTFI